jgi:hypothetical protein
VIDGLGHVRALVAPNGAITEVWHYDSWGNPISPPADRIDQPFPWTGAYGWTYTPFTGLYHLNPDYDPRTGRYLQRQGSNPTNPYIAQENDPINNIDENLSLGGTQGLLQRGLPKDQQQQLVGTLKASGQFVAEWHPGVLAVEAAYGRDCYGERQLSAWERIGAAVGAVGGFLGRAWHGAQTVGRSVAQTGARVIVVGYARARQSVYRVLKREGQVHHVLSEQIMKRSSTIIRPCEGGFIGSSGRYGQLRRTTTVATKLGIERLIKRLSTGLKRIKMQRRKSSSPSSEKSTPDTIC